MTIPSNKKNKKVEGKPRITFVRPEIDFNDPSLTEEQINEAIAKCAEEMTSAILGGKQDRYWGEIHRKIKGK